MTTQMEAEKQVDALVTGLRCIVEAKARSAPAKMQRQLLVILRNLLAFASHEHFERKLAIYTAYSLLQLVSTNVTSARTPGRQEQIMRVRSCRNTSLMSIISVATNRRFYRGGCSRSCGSLLGRGA
jgi:hypothetical protein